MISVVYTVRTPVVSYTERDDEEVRTEDGSHSGFPVPQGTRKESGETQRKDFDKSLHRVGSLHTRVQGLPLSGPSRYSPLRGPNGDPRSVTLTYGYPTQPTTGNLTTGM